MSDQAASEETEQGEQTRSKSSNDRPQRQRRPAGSGEGRQRPSSTSSRPSEDKPKRSTLTARKAAGTALKQLQELTTRTPESVVGVERHEDGWAVTIEVVESARIPNTADIMAEYEVTLDGRGDMTSYARGARYSRGRTREGQ